MSEPKDKKPAGDKNASKKNTPPRDQNGRFANDKKTDDGTVKIKIVREDKQSGATKDKAKDGESRQAPDIKAYIFRFSDEVPFPDFPDFPEFPDFPRFPRMPLFSACSLRRLFRRPIEEEETQQKPTEPSIDDFAQYISEKKPNSLNFIDTRYYSEQYISKVLAEAVAECAAKASMEEEQAPKVAEDQKKDLEEQANIAKAQEDIRKKACIHNLAAKLSKAISYIIAVVFCIGLGSAAVYGLYQIWRVLFR